MTNYHDLYPQPIETKGLSFPFSSLLPSVGSLLEMTPYELKNAFNKIAKDQAVELIIAACKQAGRDLSRTESMQGASRKETENFIKAAMENPKFQINIGELAEQLQKSRSVDKPGFVTGLMNRSNRLLTTPRAMKLSLEITPAQADAVASLSDEDAGKMFKKRIQEALQKEKSASVAQR